MPLMSLSLLTFAALPHPGPVGDDLFHLGTTGLVREPDDALLGFALSYRRTGGSGLEPTFPLQALVRTRASYPAHPTPQILGEGILHKALSPEGWALFGRAQANLLISDSATLYGRGIATFMATELAQKAAEAGDPDPHDDADVTAIFCAHGILFYSRRLEPRIAPDGGSVVCRVPPVWPLIALPFGHSAHHSLAAKVALSDLAREVLAMPELCRAYTVDTTIQLPSLTLPT